MINLPETLNADFIDQQYRKWKSDPDALSNDWQFFFKGFELAYLSASAPAGPGHDPKQVGVESLIYRYRDMGHFLACMDPLSSCPISHPLLEIEAFGLDPKDMESTFYAEDLALDAAAPLKTIINALKETYCQSIGVEYMHLQDPDERKWLQDRMEPVRNKPDLARDEKLKVLEKLIQASGFEAFLNKKFVGVTRFSLEGGDALIPLLQTAFSRAAGQGCKEVTLGMAHRGRLNVQANILGKPFEEIFSEFENCYDPDHLVGAGDVKYHNGFLAEGDDAWPGIYMVSNPSHLEAVDPVVQGVARARQDRLGDNAAPSVLPVLIHGDAAFAGQGVVAETLNMSQLKGYKTGGTLHIIINNQIGYTTLPEDARSTRYSTDVAKMLMVPIFHVHGENPEAVVHVARLAADYRHQFGKDVVIDLVCYRRYGHNEGDEPYFTQPTMYQRIKERPSLDLLYGRNLVEEGVVTQNDIDRIGNDYLHALETAFDGVHGSSCLFPQPRFFREWDAIKSAYSHGPVKTALAGKGLVSIARELAVLPEGFTLHPRLKRVLKKRLDTVESGSNIDWANAEALAFASLLKDGIGIRLSGQDVGRGTFSQRHSVLWDYKTGDFHIPLNHLADTGARFNVHNSLLAEAGVLGFEYGYAVTTPWVLTLWEAQFGDFVNNAQSVIDLFIASGQDKWQQLCGLVMLLPHGLEGLGPEHSSARLERFLQLCANDNMQVCNLTTPAQYFHLLRRQVMADFRKPLILMTPKSLLRHPMAVSDLKDFSSKGFAPVLDDPKNVTSAQKVLLCSGKIYYQLLARRSDLNQKDVAIIRLEQFYPFPKQQLKKMLNRYKKAKEWVWVQEEPKNMGGWQFVQPRIESVIGNPLSYVGRPPASSPATGFPKIYKMQQDAISDQAVGPLKDKK